MVPAVVRKVKVTGWQITRFYQKVLGLLFDVRRIGHSAGWIQRLVGEIVPGMVFSEYNCLKWVGEIHNDANFLERC
jgi:hypothetical protein